jgi:hypothetical protein
MHNIPEEYYPTPLHIINKMVDGIDFNYISSVLEPSAGEGHLVKIVADKMDYKHNNYSHDRKKYNPDIDCIEINENFRHILKGKGYRVIHDDFLTLDTYKQYSLIVMNPPFSNGDQHLLKALEMQKSGGNIVCLLNAETLKNPYSNRRKELTQKLDEYNASIEYIQNAFYDAERKTDVEIALIKIHIPEAEKSSYIYEQLKQEKPIIEAEQPDEYYSLVHNDFIKAIVGQYKLEIKAGINLINEFNAMKPVILRSFEKNDKGEYVSKQSILELTVDNPHNSDGDYPSINTFIKRVRHKYWKALFDNKEFTGQLTGNLRQDYYNRINELVDYDFSLFNIYTIKLEMSKNMVQGIEDTILNLFDEFSHKYYWDKDNSANIHYYNGWKTNSAWKINKKVIIPLSCYSWSGYLDYMYKVREKLEDIEKVFNYLDGGLTANVNLVDSLKLAQDYGDTKKIPLKYFNISFYQKGTAHIEFTNLELLAKFNLYASQRKGWLPPSYGKKAYKDMNSEEKMVIDDYEGQQEYNKVMNNKQYYLVESNQLLQLGA